VQAYCDVSAEILLRYEACGGFVVQGSVRLRTSSWARPWDESLATNGKIDHTVSHEIFSLLPLSPLREYRDAIQALLKSTQRFTTLLDRTEIQYCQSSTFAMASSNAEAAETTTVRSDSLSPGPSDARPKSKWRPYHSLGSSTRRKWKLDEALKKFGGRKTQEAPPEPTSLSAARALRLHYQHAEPGTDSLQTSAHDEPKTPSPTIPPSKSLNALTAPEVPCNHPYHGLSPKDRARWFNSLPSYRTSPASRTSFNALYSRSSKDGTEDGQALVSPTNTNVVWDGHRIVPAHDTPIPPTPTPTSTPTPLRPQVATQPGPSHSSPAPQPNSPSDKKSHSICSSMRTTFNRLNSTAKETRIPTAAGASTLSVRFGVNGAPWAGKRPKLEFEMLQPKKKQGKRVTEPLSTSKFHSEAIKTGEEHNATPPTRRTSTRLPRPRDGGEGARGDTVPSKAPISSTNGDTQKRRVRRSSSTPNNLDSRLPTLAHRRRDPSSGQLLGPARLSDTIRRAPDSILSTSTATPTPPTPTPTQSQNRNYNTPSPAQPTLSDLLRYTTLHDTPLSPEEVHRIKDLLLQVDQDTQKHNAHATWPRSRSTSDSNSQDDLRAEPDETVGETRAKVKERLRVIDDEAARQLRDRRRRDARQRRSRPRHQESVEGLSAYSGSVAYEPVRRSGLRHVESVDDEVDGKGSSTHPSIQGIDSEKRPGRNGTSPSGTSSGTTHASPTQVDGTDRKLHQSYVEEAVSKSDEENRRAKKATEGDSLGRIAQAG